MDFVTEYKNIKFHMTLEKTIGDDPTLFLGDKFHRLPNQTMIELKKGAIRAYNLVIRSIHEDEERTHYWSNVLLINSQEQDELIEELGHYLDDEEILEQIVKNWNLAGDELGPAWR